MIKNTTRTESFHSCDELQVSFEAAAGGGYEWRLKSSDPELEVNQIYGLPVNKDDSVGGSLTVDFYISASKPGTYEAEFEYKRSWEEKAEEACKMTIHVK